MEGYNVVREDRPPQDDNGHGTHVAGTIAATFNNNIGIAGVAPGVSIMPVKVLSRTGAGIDEPAARGIRWAVDHGAWVINLSFGETLRDTEGLALVREAIDYAIALGAVVVVAAGNNGTTEASDLATAPGVIVVGGRFTGPLAHSDDLAARMVKFCPDLIDGEIVETPADVAKGLDGDRTFFFWWD